MYSLPPDYAENYGKYVWGIRGKIISLNYVQGILDELKQKETKKEAEIHESKYRSTGKRDKNGVEILEGSIIRADGYGSDLSANRFYCVEYNEDKAMFTSIIYGDEDPLSMYQEIEVIGHCEDYRELYERGELQGTGNIRAVMK